MWMCNHKYEDDEKYQIPYRTVDEIEENRSSYIYNVHDKIESCILHNFDRGIINGK